MTLWCQQLVDGEAIDPEFIIPGDPQEMLQVKAASAGEKGWDVEWLSPTSFVARKVRWQPDALCERLFEIR